jgi:tRNA(Arg) A34 adenosine deaminase TadA
MSIETASIDLKFPTWYTEWERTLPDILPTDTDAMSTAISISSLNVKRGYGGPFGAVAVESGSRKIVATGMNVVLTAKSSLLHAEIACIIRAQKALNSHTLKSADIILYSSSEPCAMCMGAIPWSGISQLVCAARDEDVRAIGYDEGLKPDNWAGNFNKQYGIKVIRDFMRDEAVSVLQSYAHKNGIIY